MTNHTPPYKPRRRWGCFIVVCLFVFSLGYMVKALQRTAHSFVVLKHIDENTYVIEQKYDGLPFLYHLTLIAGNCNDGYRHFYLNHESAAWDTADVRRKGPIIEIVHDGDLYATLDLRTSVTTHMDNKSTRSEMERTDRLPEI